MDDVEQTYTIVGTHIEGDFAWVLADANFKAIIKSDQSELNVVGKATFLFRRIDGKWMVVHFHES